MRSVETHREGRSNTIPVKHLVPGGAAPLRFDGVGSNAVGVVRYRRGDTVPLQYSVAVVSHEFFGFGDRQLHQRWTVVTPQLDPRHRQGTIDASFSVDPRTHWFHRLNADGQWHCRAGVLTYLEHRFEVVTDHDSVSALAHNAFSADPSEVFRGQLNAAEALDACIGSFDEGLREGARFMHDTRQAFIAARHERGATGRLEPTGHDISVTARRALLLSHGVRMMGFSGAKEQRELLALQVLVRLEHGLPPRSEQMRYIMDRISADL